MITIRAAILDDIEDINRVLERSYPKLMSDTYSKEVLKATLPLMIKANETLVASNRYAVAESVNGKVIGCGGWSHERPYTYDTKEGIAHIRHFATDPDHARQKVGRKIFEWCRDAAEIEKVQLFECFSNLNAEGFYSSLGFNEAKKIKVEMKPSIFLDVMHMKYDFNNII